MEKKIKVYKFLTFFSVLLAIITIAALLCHYEGVFTPPRPWAGWVGLFFMITAAMAANKEMKKNEKDNSRE